MPAVSRSQRRFFGMVEHNPEIAKERGIHMTHQQMHDFAATKEKGLPQHVAQPGEREQRRRKYYGE